MVPAELSHLGQQPRPAPSPCEGDILLPRFDERAVLLEQAGRFPELRLRQAHSQPSRSQVGAESGNYVVLIGLVRAGPIGNGVWPSQWNCTSVKVGRVPPAWSAAVTESSHSRGRTRPVPEQHGKGKSCVLRPYSRAAPRRSHTTRKVCPRTDIGTNRAYDGSALSAHVGTIPRMGG